jgi:hypothetical protein
MLGIERAGKGAQLQVIPHIMTLVQELRAKRDQGPITTTVAVDRLFQLIQMLISSECLDRNEIRESAQALNNLSWFA